jgi:glycosyltransferase involved in cell wall biosynthesis
MNILFITNIPTPYRIDFFNDLGKLCNLTVLFERKLAKNRNSEWLGKNNKNFEVHFLKGVPMGEDSSLSFHVFKWLKDRKYDLIIVGGYSTPTGMLSIIFLNLINRPYVLNIDGGIIKKDNPIKYLIKKYFISGANYWLSPGESATKYIVHYGAKRKKIYEYPFSSITESDVLSKDELKSVDKSIIRERLGIKEDRVVLMVGQIIYRKGIDLLLNAAKDAKTIGFYVVGGEATQEYQDMIDKWGLSNVHFTGFMSKMELNEYYLASDLFVLPTREDIWGLVINEAMSKGLPIITTDKCVAGIELIQNNVNGYIIPSGDKEILSQTIKGLIKNEKLLSEMAINNLYKIKKYTIRNMTLRHMEIFINISKS